VLFTKHSANETTWHSLLLSLLGRLASYTQQLHSISVNHNPNPNPNLTNPNPNPTPT